MISNEMFWLAAVVIFAVAEATTQGLVSIWFAGGALAGLIAAMIGASITVQTVIFIAVSAILILALRKIAVKSQRSRMLKLYKKTEGLNLRLLNMLLRKIVHHPETHFFRIRSPKEFNGSAIEFRTDPCFRIQPDTDRSVFLLFHKITPPTGCAENKKTYAECFDTLCVCCYSGFLSP